MTERRRTQLVLCTLDELTTLHRCGGYYRCPKNRKGERLGPLVGYAGRDGQGRQFVGDEYANYAMAEENPHVIRSFARNIAGSLKLHSLLERIDTFCGVPEGGVIFASVLADICDRRFIRLEKEVTALKTETTREKTKLVFKRHTVRKRENIVIVEDVLNNFSSTDEAICRIEEESDGNVIAIVACLNRSMRADVSEHYTAKDGTRYPIIAQMHRPIAEWRQDDPAVADDVAKNNVVWKPKDEWPRLEQAMPQHPES